MTRISDTARHAGKKTLKPVFKSTANTNKTVATLPGSVEERWQDRAGEEYEETGNYSSEECYFAQTFAHDHGDFDGGLD